MGFGTCHLVLTPKCMYQTNDSTHKALKERDNLKNSAGDPHDDENTDEGAGHQEKCSFNPPLLKEEANNAS